jgi:translation initiation factor 1 (eIF-1/SUI1)
MNQTRKKMMMQDSEGIGKDIAIDSSRKIERFIYTFVFGGWIDSNDLKKLLKDLKAKVIDLKVQMRPLKEK